MRGLCMISATISLVKLKGHPRLLFHTFECPRKATSESFACGRMDTVALVYNINSGQSWRFLDASKMTHSCHCRFNYSKEFLKWALHPPGYTEDWHVAIRVKATQKLVAFISAVPSLTQVKKQKVDMVDINFLCVHKKLRSKRLAPVLIKVNSADLPIPSLVD